MSRWTNAAAAMMLLFSTVSGSVQVMAADTEPEEPVLKAVCTEGYPGLNVTLTLQCENNPGFTALGLTVQLPDVLTPVTDESQAVKFKSGSALCEDASAYSFYDAESGRLSFVYASPEDGPAEDEIVSFTLKVAADADPEAVYTIVAAADMMTDNAGGSIETAESSVQFTPLVWPEITLSDTEITISENGDPYYLTLSPKPPAGSVKWSSDHFDIAAVLPSGAVYGMDPGSAVITVTCGPYTFTCHVTVEPKPGLQLNITDYAARTLGEQFQLTAPGVQNQPIFSSSAPELFSVDKNGTVTVLGEGEADIMVKADGKSSTCHVMFLPYMRGDANLNNEITASDAQTVLIEYLETTVLEMPSSLSAQQRLAADADLDSSITLHDAMLILYYYSDILNGIEPDWDAAAAAMKGDN